MTILCDVQGDRHAGLQRSCANIHRYRAICPSPLRTKFTTVVAMRRQKSPMEMSYMDVSSLRASSASGARGLFFTTNSSAVRALALSPLFSNASPK